MRKPQFHPVGVERPNPQYAALLQEQLGGGNGELKAAMQYMSQSFRIKDRKIKDLFLDIAAEELGHMEMVAQTINLLNGHDVDADQVKAGEIQTHVLLGLNPGLINASGYSWTGDYVTVTGDLCADLLSNIASNRDFGTTKAAKMYFSMSNPGPNAFAGNDVNAPNFSK